MSVLDRRAPITTKRYSFLSRCLAALTLMFIYVVSTSAILVGASTTEAQAKWGRGRGYGRGYARGYGRGYGRGYRGRGYYGRGYGFYGGRGCYFSYRWGRVVCY